MNKTSGLLWAIVGMLLSLDALAVATCTSKASGNWNSTGTWNCVGTPTVTTPGASNFVVIANGHTVNLNNNDRSAASLTINTGGTLNDDNQTLTVSGDVINNGTFGTNGGSLSMTRANSTISGTGIYNDTDIEIDALGISFPSGSVMTLTNQAQIRVGNNNNATFALDGTVTGTALASGDRVLRVYRNSSATIAGTINAPNAYIRVERSASVTNNGSVTVQYLDSDGNNTTSVWTQGANSSLTVTQTPANRWRGTLNASATGNTVTYNGTATPLTPSASTYYNLAGTRVTCPHAFTVLGSDPCVAVPGGPVSVTLSPGTCVDDATLGTTTWGGLTNVGSSNNAYATTTTVAARNTQLTHYLKCTNYGFAIPDGATINGISVGVERKISSTSRTTGKDNAMRIVKAGLIGATDRSSATNYTTTDVTVAHGGAADLWGQVWTPADINAATFGAAISASVTTTRTNSRTVSVDHMPITVTYTAGAAAPHHIQIDHDGTGQTCRAETLTVTACANAACTAPHFTAADVSGNVTWTGSPGGNIPFAIAAGGTGQTTVSLPVASAQTVTLGTSSVSPVQTNPPSTCVNAGGGTACSLVFSSATACFDAVEVGAATTSLYTKLSGTAFSLDVTAASAYSGTLQVELVNASSGACATYASLSPANTQSTTFASQTRKTLNFTYAGAARNVKVRITGAGASSCSSGRFAIRPQSMTVTSSVNADPLGADVAATPVVKAGANFTLNAATGIAGYDGTPAVDNTKISAHSGSVVNGTVSGAFGAADSAGLATGSSFTYNEVGYFKVDAEGVYDDTFTAIDSATGDCTNDFSNTLVGGKYGCKFGNTAASAFFGRFIPDHFGVTSGEFDNRADWCDQGELVSDGVTACVSPAFTYMGELMNANFTLTAESSSNTPTQNYQGTFAKLTPFAADNTLVFGVVDGATPTNLTSRLDTSLVSASGSGSFVNGAADISVPLAITRGATEDGPYADLNVGIAPVDSDNVATVFDLDTDGDAVADRTQVNGAATEVRYGRTKLSNAHGSELLALPMTATAEFWDGADWAVSTTDNETSLTLNAAGYQHKTGGAWAVVPPVNATVTSGILNYTLSNGGGTGSVDISVSTPTYLPGNTARATFGVYKGNKEIIYLRENY